MRWFHVERSRPIQAPWGDGRSHRDGAALPACAAAFHVERTAASAHPEARSDQHASASGLRAGHRRTLGGGPLNAAAGHRVTPVLNETLPGQYQVIAWFRPALPPHRLPTLRGVNRHRGHQGTTVRRDPGSVGTRPCPLVPRTTILYFLVSARGRWPPAHGPGYSRSMTTRRAGSRPWLRLVRPST